MISVAVRAIVGIMTMINDSDLKTLAQRIRAARQMAGLRQEDLADECGASRSAVNEWEHGRSEPSATRMFALARATNQPLSWFAEGLDSGVRPKRLELPTFCSVAEQGFWTSTRALSWLEFYCQDILDTESSYSAGVS